MRVYLVRHADALPDRDDQRRSLSDVGRETTRTVAKFLRENGAFKSVHAVWHSHLLRARQTAELLMKELGFDVLVVEAPGLLPEDDPVPIADRLDDLAEPLVIVGHEPQLSALATLLVRGKVKPVAFEFKKSAVLALEKSGGRHKKSDRARWRVRWFLAPELLERAGPG
jgi:phosphohistidine phosphatase